MDSSWESGAALALDDGKVLQMDALVRAVTHRYRLFTTFRCT